MSVTLETVQLLLLLLVFFQSLLLRCAVPLLVLLPLLLLLHYAAVPALQGATQGAVMNRTMVMRTTLQVKN